MTAKPYYNKDKTATAILISSCYGSGWSTYNIPELAYDRRVVEYWFKHCLNTVWMKAVAYDFESPEHAEADDAFFTSIGYPDVNFLGFANIKLLWVEKNVPFVIEEYDGAEYLMRLTDYKWTILN